MRNGCTSVNCHNIKSIETASFIYLCSTLNIKWEARRRHHFQSSFLVSQRLNMKSFALQVAILVASIYICGQNTGVFGREVGPTEEGIENKFSIGNCRTKLKRNVDECSQFFEGTPPCKRSHCTYASSRHGLRLCSFWQLNATDCHDDEMTKAMTPKPLCEPVGSDNHCSIACSEHWKDNWNKNYLFTGGAAFICTSEKKSVCGCAQIATPKFVVIDEVRVKRDAMDLHITTTVSDCNKTCIGWYN